MPLGSEGLVSLFGFSEKSIDSKKNLCCTLSTCLHSDFLLTSTNFHYRALNGLTFSVWNATSGDSVCVDWAGVRCVEQHRDRTSHVSNENRWIFVSGSGKHN